MFHYTDDTGFKAIAPQPAWKFKAFEPKGPHPDGAYFTSLPPVTPNLAKRLRVPKTKLTWLFEFLGQQGLVPMDGGKGRGQYIFYSPSDYHVDPTRQRYRGPTREYPQEDLP